MNRLWYVIYIILQCTWGIVQTGIGLILFWRYRKEPHRFFYGAVHTGWKREDGISLGLFMFSPDTGEAADRLLIHEYGHTYQSLLLGPLYLAVIGIPSMIWSRCTRYIRLRREYGVPYSFFFAEHWADWLGERTAGKQVQGND